MISKVLGDGGKPRDGIVGFTCICTHLTQTLGGAGNGGDPDDRRDANVHYARIFRGSDGGKVKRTMDPTGGMVMVLDVGPPPR